MEPTHRNRRRLVVFLPLFPHSGEKGLECAGSGVALLSSAFTNFSPGSSLDIKSLSCKPLCLTNPESKQPPEIQRALSPKFLLSRRPLVAVPYPDLPIIDLHMFATQVKYHDSMNAFL